MAETLTLVPPKRIPIAELFHRRRKWILLFAGAGFSSYFVYRLYHLPEVSKRRRKLYDLLITLISIADAVSSSAEIVSILSSDFNSFLLSDSDGVPASLKQVSKIVRSEEFVDSLSRVSEALTSGIIKGIGSGSTDSPASSSGFSDRVLDKVFSPSETGFASVVVGSFARNLAMGLMHRGLDSPATPAWMEVFGSDHCKGLVGNCIEKFVSTLVTAYLEKTAGANTYDELFAGITNPKHDTKVKAFFVSVCNGTVETLVWTSYQVITAPNEEKEGNLILGSSPDVVDEETGWFDKVTSTLAAPSNRRFVLDVTGRVTFETVRSFLDFVLWKFYDGARRGVRIVGDGAMERGMEVVRYFSAKSMLIVTICLALCMRVMLGTKFLMPA